MKWTNLLRDLTAVFSAVAIVAGAALADDGQRKSVTIQGATTVASLISPWATEYQEGKDEPSVVVYGSTHGRGLEALFNKQADLAMLAKKLSPEEKAKASEKGMKLEEVFLGNDAIPIIVNAANPVDELSFDQLRNIFTEQYKSWKDVGGPDEPIEVITLPSDSGMRQFLGKILLKGDFGPNSRVISSISLAPKIVQVRKGAISFCRQDLGTKEHANGTLKMIKVRRDSSSPAVMPTGDNVASGAYPLIRELLLAYDAQTVTENAKRFITFCLKKATANGAMASLQTNK